MARSITRSPSRPRDEDEEEKTTESTPRRPRRPGAGRPSRNRDEDSEERNVSSTIDEGWESFERYDKETASGDFADDLEVPDDSAVLVKILDDKPLTYKQHWIEGRGKGKKKSFVCAGDGCPLCDEVGDKPRAMAVFHVVDFSDPDNPTLKVLRQGPMVTKILKKFSEDKKTAPINRPDYYFDISKETVNKKVSYTIVPVKARDLEEDYEGLVPLTDEEIEAFEEQRFERDQIVRASTKGELREIADEVLDD